MSPFRSLLVALIVLAGVAAFVLSHPTTDPCHGAYKYAPMCQR